MSCSITSEDTNGHDEAFNGDNNGWTNTIGVNNVMSAVAAEAMFTKLSELWAKYNGNRPGALVMYPDYKASDPCYTIAGPNNVP